MKNVPSAVGFKSRPLVVAETAQRDLQKIEALQGLSANVMIADADYNIVYVNDSIIEFLRELEADIRRDLPAFNVDTLIGTNIDSFHKSPGHQRKMLDRMNTPIETSIKVGGVVFNLRAFPVFDNLQRRLGTVVEWKDSEEMDNAAQIKAINRAMAVIEFGLDGTIAHANENFLKATGYELRDIKGQHHRMFVDPAYASSPDYRAFWDCLSRGEYQSGEYQRFARGGREIWIQASYNPIVDLNGKPFKVVKYASDVTQSVMARMRNERVKDIITENIAGIDGAISSASGQSSKAAQAAGETSATVQSIAAGAEELNSSVEEIAKSMAVSKVSVDQAYDQTLSADQATQMLSSAAQSMGGIVELIQAIANQINLLALNATIESARAGEAGKGFAVVANEVKNLAMQTTTATEQISREIDGMQNISGDVVRALEVIKESIESVRDNVTGVAAAVGEQSSVTQEMSNNMQIAASAVTHISSSMNEIVQATTSATEATRKIRDAISE